MGKENEQTEATVLGSDDQIRIIKNQTTAPDSQRLPRSALATYIATFIPSAQLWLSGRGALASATNGFTAGTQFEQSTNKQNFLLPSFPASAQKYAEWEIAMPSDYNGGTITAKFHWTANSTSTNSVVWGLQGRAYADTDTIDQAWGTAVEVTDANQSTAYKLNISAATAAITLAGSPAAGQLVKFRAYRLGSGADNLAVAVFLIGIQVTYTRT